MATETERKATADSRRERGGSGRWVPGPGQQARGWVPPEPPSIPEQVWGSVSHSSKLPESAAGHGQAAQHHACPDK